MAKDNPKAAGNKHMKARIAFLDKASKYLANQQTASNHAGNQSGTSGSTTVSSQAEESGMDPLSIQKPAPGLKQGLPLLLASHLRAVSLKSQMRLSQDLKRSICKVCNTPLITEATSDASTENLSKGGRKAHADALVVSCRTCGTKKRFPVGAQRQKKKAQRRTEDV